MPLPFWVRACDRPVPFRPIATDYARAHAVPSTNMTGLAQSIAYVLGPRMSVKSGIDVAFPARPESSPQLRHALRAFLEQLRLDGGRIDDMLLAAGEAAGNAIEHAYRERAGNVRLVAYVASDRLVVEVRDSGRWQLDGDPQRGRGLGIMRALVDRVSIESTRLGTSVRLELALRSVQA